MLLKEKVAELQEYFLGTTPLSSYNTADELWSDLQELKTNQKWELDWSNGQSITRKDIDLIFNHIN